MRDFVATIILPSEWSQQKCTYLQMRVINGKQTTPNFSRTGTKVVIVETTVINAKSGTAKPLVLLSWSEKLSLVL